MARKIKEDQKQSRIIFDADDWDFISEYQKTTGCSFQFFVNSAVKDKIISIKAEQFLKDQELLNK